MCLRGTSLFVLLGLILSIGAFAEPIFHKAEPDGWTAPLQKLGITGSIDSLAEPRNWRTKQVSSYDRAGGPDDDKHAELVYEGGTILAELEGPGCLTRIWTRNPQGTVYIYIDDLEYPRIVAPFESLFKGDLEYHSPGFNLFAPPFVSESSGGYVSYVPIPYEKACRVMVSGADSTLGYQVTYVEFPAGTEIRSFELALTDSDISFFRRWRKEWEDTNFRWVDRDTEKYHHSRQHFWPNKDSLLLPLEGPGVITELEFEVGSADKDILDNAWLAIYFDGQETPGVLAPLGDFFGTMTSDASDHDSMLLGRDNGRMWCRYPMPFKRGIEIRINNTSGAVADIDYGITWRPGPIGDQSYFFARYQSAEAVAGEAYRVADIEGKGHFVGCSLAATNADSLEFLDGDDTYLIDGSAAASFHGTGTDDYFNAGWYFATGPFSRPTHGATVKSGDGPAAFAAFRTLISDPVPFNESFVFELEHGNRNNQEGVAYSSVAYWYQSEAKQETWAIAELKDVEFRRERLFVDLLPETSD